MTAIHDIGALASPARKSGRGSTVCCQSTGLDWSLLLTALGFGDVAKLGSPLAFTRASAPFMRSWAKELWLPRVKCCRRPHGRQTACDERDGRGSHRMAKTQGVPAGRGPKAVSSRCPPSEEGAAHSCVHARSLDLRERGSRPRSRAGRSAESWGGGLTTPRDGRPRRRAAPPSPG